MGVLEGIIYMLWRGLAIGVIISAPMGPVGILCVQRTLEKGRRTGFYTGVGAALSDLIYCLITGFGLSFVEEFLKSNQNVIQLIGSVVLAVFGVYLFRSNPSRTLRKPDSKDSSPQKDILSGFLFTFSNPLIVFLIIGLFARFNFLLPEITWFDYIIGFISVIVGALGWWWVVTFAINKVRAHFNLRSMWLINKIIGGVIMIFAIVGAVSAIGGLSSAKAGVREPMFLNRARGFRELGEPGQPLTLTNPSADTLNVGLPTVAGLESLEFRVRNLNNEAGKKYQFTDSCGKIRKTAHPGWGVWLTDVSGDTLRITFNTIDDTRSSFDSPRLQISRKSIRSADKESPKLYDSGFDFFTGENSFIIRRFGDCLILRGGNRENKELLRMEFGNIMGAGIMVAPGGRIQLDNIVMSGGALLSREVAYTDVIQLMERLSRSQDPMEGLWEEFDREMEENKMRPGGRYRLALAERPGGYDIVYLSGALKNPEAWEEGLLKGRLEKTSFRNVFRVEWFDVEGNPVAGETVAQFETPDLLTISFPYQDSRLRLRRVR